MLLVCKGCGEEFECDSKRGSKPRFCSRDCRRGLASEYCCQECGKSFSGHKRRFCSKTCRETYHRTAQRVIKPCERCGNDFDARDKRIRFCSMLCANHGKNTSDSRMVIAAGTCPNCGEDFARITHGAGPSLPTFCSKYCRNAQHVRNRQHWRRSGKKGRITKIELSDLYQRDGGKCQLCGKVVDMNAKNLSRKPTIDHIIPLSKGGLHEWSNVQLAHLGCNSRKQAKAGSQLRLFG